MIDHMKAVGEHIRSRADALYPAFLGPNPLECCPDNIWQYKQNRPSLIVADLFTLAGVPRWVTARVLMSRGVYKWFAARRDLIRLKDRIKAKIRSMHKQAIACKAADPHWKGTLSHAEWKGRLQALEQVRADIRRITHSQRWRAPDNDPFGTRLLYDGHEGRSRTNRWAGWEAQ